MVQPEEHKRCLPAQMGYSALPSSGRATAGVTQAEPFSQGVLLDDLQASLPFRESGYEPSFQSEADDPFAHKCQTASRRGLPASDRSKVTVEGCQPRLQNRLCA